MGVFIDLGEFNAKSGMLVALFEQRTTKAITEIAQVCEMAAADRAPFKEGILTASIESEVIIEGDEKNAIIRVPVNAPSSKYAIKMHEEDYNLGPGSVAKQARVGVEVGKGYIINGILDSSEDIKDIIKDNIKV